MAVIGTIRKHSALAVILVGVAIGAFIVSDLFTGKRGRGRSVPTVGVIAGEEITVITPQSPLGGNLMGKKPGQRWTAKVGGATFKYQVVSVC